MSSPATFVPGQRWISLTEPELGLGIVHEVEDRQVVVRFPAREVTRRYGISDAPLARARLSPGQEVRSDAGVSFRVESVEERDQLLHYQGAGHDLCEAELDAHLDVVTPENRLRSGQVDPHPLFDLRSEALHLHHDMLASPARGFLGGRIRLFDHQLSIARDVCERYRVRVLLADEVGLGKTIEALLILHRMLLTGRVERALVLVPPALVHQWLAEAFLRFNLILRVLGRDSLDSKLFEPEDETLRTQMVNSQLCICPLDEEGNAALETEAFDLLIVDEAHHLVPDGAAFELVDRLAGKIDHVLILSATPDRDGESAHFRRLALLDPSRFRDPAAYLAEAEHYSAMADAAERLQRGEPLRDPDRALLRERLGVSDAEIVEAERDEAVRRPLLGRLLDLHGIGRVMFRNVRARIPGFPRRVYRPHVLEDGDPEALRAEFLADMGLAITGPAAAGLTDPELTDAGLAESFEPGIGPRSVRSDPRCRWLRAFLVEDPSRRVLALCSSKDKVEAFVAALEGRKRKVARFHEEMTSIHRDRQAAWFLADDGPQLLISSAIGAEGRNFQVARHLVLLDLPSTPDRLEQLIGRVDRIGQGDEVHIHVPVVAGTPQAHLARWYEALRIFEIPWHGAPAMDREFAEPVLEAVIDAGAGDNIDAWIERGRRRNQEIVLQLERGRDRLLELTSFDLEAAHELSDAIASAQEDDRLEQFMILAFERAGLKVERIDYRSYAVEAGVEYHRPFPGFVGQEMWFTFDRRTGLRHPERILLTYDHPMVRDTIDDLLAHESGNACVTMLPAGEQRALLLEALFVAEPTVASELRADRFFPPTPIRIVVDTQLRRVGLDAEKARTRLRPVDAVVLEQDAVQSRLQPMQEQARRFAESRCPEIAEAARARMQREIGAAVARLEDLSRENPCAALAEELAMTRRDQAALDAGLRGYRVRLDALRVILVVPESEHGS